MRNLNLLTLACLLCATGAFAGDWPMWGGTVERNMVSAEKNLPSEWSVGTMKEGTEEVDLTTTKNIKWVAKLGSQSYGNVTVSGGRVFVGTNNETPRDRRYEGDHGTVYCLDEKTGEFQWQLVVPKLGAGKVSDWEFLGICSSPEVEGERVYIVTNRCEVVCLDVNGMKNGNDGPYKEEMKHAGVEGEPAATDADIVWIFDMREELGVFPHNITSSSVLIDSDRIYVTTSNGQDWSHVNIPQPNAPSLCVLDKKDGTLVAEEAVGISKRLFHCTWSSPSLMKQGEQKTVIFGAGDGFVYGFDPTPSKDADGLMVIKDRWRFDCNPPEHKKDKDGKPFKYPSDKGYSEIIATPVVYKDRVYVAVGQDPEHGEGVGCLSCIDATKSGDVTATGAVWQYKDINRTISTVSIADGLVYAADYAGDIHCLDAETGKLYWKHATRSHIWSSTLAADGKVYVGTEDGQVVILQQGKEKKVLAAVEMGAPVYSTPVVANGVLYVATQTHLYAIQQKP